MLEASIVVIGDEILGGFVQDTNSGWAAARLQTLGVPLTRVVTVPDSYEAIGEALQTELARSRPRVIVTSGGIGSTPDDLTYEAVAASLDRDLVAHPVLSGRIDGALDWTRQQGIDVTDEFAWHMMRMARIPAGGRLLHEGGWAPGIGLDVDGGVDEGGASIVILPGVPSQFRRSSAPRSSRSSSTGATSRLAVSEITHGFPESALNLCFARVIDDHPDVKLGSYPGVPMMVRLIGPRKAVDAAAADVRAALSRWRSPRRAPGWPPRGPNGWVAPTRSPDDPPAHVRARAPRRRVVEGGGDRRPLRRRGRRGDARDLHPRRGRRGAEPVVRPGAAGGA